MKKSLLLPVFGLLALGNTAFAQCPTGQTQVSVSITTDNYGEETSWTLTGPGGTPVYASAGNLADATTIPAVTACVPNGAVIIFSIFDSYGDGICCQYGTGSYTVTAGGNTVATGGEFDAEEITYFQTGTPASLDMAALTIGLPSVVAQGNQSATSALTAYRPYPVLVWRAPMPWSQAVTRATLVTSCMHMPRSQTDSSRARTSFHAGGYSNHRMVLFT